MNRKDRRHWQDNPKIVELTKNVEAPIPSSIKEAISVLKHLASELESKISKSSVSNPIAKALVGKSMGLDPALLDGIMNMNEQNTRMELAALYIAIEALEQLDDEQ